ncbi:TPA: hypothetical protein ACH1LG_004738 [Salmonella enterica]|jgi:hypothetical protein|uniref:Uncharacterized protein n=8 Tax=root TaxID=1 RepID=A0A8S5UII1_9CAUD|nr:MULTISPECIES: hypothetical protein [Enterococcus]ELG7156124.1 hypothetical protein [Staphylococcus aureus]DAF94174.1 MAG TPA: hypothetical protein [Myoviridae sp. ctu2j3]ELL1201391.1 hypothetical protein [Staphylococcus aureus]MDN3040702.1 hypothetical protein [Enterococcus faecium]MDN3104128.1 hypothetical protein [Enterococcus faecalis]
MTNFLKETEEAIADSGHVPEDIIFIGSRTTGHSCTWDEFQTIADFEYDSGYGGQEVVSDIEIVFNDGQSMHRGEYDGSEWWEYSCPFEMPQTLHPIQHLRDPQGCSWVSLAEANEPLRSPAAEEDAA